MTKRPDVDWPTLTHLIPGCQDLGEFAVHDAALKFWLPELVVVSLMDMALRNGASVNETLRQFFVQHCYGVLTFQMLLEYDRGLFKDPEPPVFSRKQREVDERPGKRRIESYWLPDLGKNIAPIKVWMPGRIRRDLQKMADHVGLSLSQYVREIVISRLIGHAKLPMREKMLDPVDLTVAERWEGGEVVRLRECDLTEYSRMLDGELRVETRD